MIRDEIEKLALTEINLDSPDSGSQQFCPGAAFIGFHGHFPGYPILPAMLQVLFGVLVTEKILAAKLILKKLDKAKFMTQIKPEETLTVSCKIIQPSAKNPAKAMSTAEIKTQVTILVKEQKAASMTLLLIPE